MILYGYEKPFRCPECSNRNFKTDFHRHERYCTRCGLIVQSSEIITIKQREYIRKIIVKNSLK